MKVLQVLPALESGGVERGTVELNRFLREHGHESVVISAGGRLVETVQRDGGRHITWPIGRKHLATLRYIWKMRGFLEVERPDVLHLRSRLPAWIAWLAWRGMVHGERPALVTTVHGFNRPGAYSAIMTRGERIIAVSDCVREFILQNYPAVDPARIRVIHRGIDPAEYPRGYRPSPEWIEQWHRENGFPPDRKLLVLPARITRLKGLEHFFEVIRLLKQEGLSVQGLVVGEAQAGRAAYLHELRCRAQRMGLDNSISFLGHRTDLREILAISDLVFSLSVEPESFGRTTIEALSLGKPVIGYDHGGVREQLQQLLPRGVVPVGDWKRATELAKAWLANPPLPAVNDRYLLYRMLISTLEVYTEACAEAIQRKGRTR